MARGTVVQTVAMPTELRDGVPIHFHDVVDGPTSSAVAFPHPKLDGGIGCNASVIQRRVATLVRDALANRSLATEITMHCRHSQRPCEAG